MLNNTLCPKSNFNNSFHEAQTAHNQGPQAHQLGFGEGAKTNTSGNVNITIQRKDFV